MTTEVGTVPPYWRNVVRYMYAVAYSGTYHHIVLVERPYATDIHPHLFSAMSYDPIKSGPTPSTMGLASMVCKDTNVRPVEIEE